MNDETCRARSPRATISTRPSARPSSRPPTRRERDLLVDPDFQDWPLNERAVVETLARWVDSRKRLIVFAHSFDELARQQPRFAEWRRQWSHIVHCRTDPDLEAEQVSDPDAGAGRDRVRLLDPFASRHGLGSGERSGRVPRND